MMKAMRYREDGDRKERQYSILVMTIFVGSVIWGVALIAVSNVAVLSEGNVTDESHEYLGAYLGDDDAGWYVIYDIELNGTSIFTIKIAYTNGLLPWNEGDYLYIIMVNWPGSRPYITAVTAPELEKIRMDVSLSNDKFFIISRVGMVISLAAIFFIVSYRIHRVFEIVDIDDNVTPREKRYYR